MKSYLLLLISIIGIQLIVAQNSTGINYQAQLFDSEDALLKDYTTSVRFTILKNSTIVFEETHENVKTDNSGRLALVIGTGTLSTGDFESIAFKETGHSLKVEYKDDSQGVWVNMGTEKFQWVPYARYAEEDGDWIKKGDSILYSDNKRIGINIPNPQGDLHIGGDAHFGSTLYLKPDTSTSSNGDLRLTGLINDGTNNYFRFYHVGGINSNASRRNLWIYGHSDRIMDVSIDGKVSIGRMKNGEDILGQLDLHGDLHVDNTIFFKPDGSALLDGDLRLSGLTNDGSNDFFKLYHLGGTNSDNSRRNLWIYGHSERKMDVSIDGNLYLGGLKDGSSLDEILHVEGMASVECLKIEGGCDITEPFEISQNELLPEGSVVIIDPDNPGKLTQSTQAYDKRVAGIISGAGGVQSGLTLSQENLMDNGQQVALVGRVYVQATSQNGPILPGDMLTTSEVAGYAMKATDSEQAFGAVIGKAMSRLDKEEGLVLVLVNLQ